MQRLLRLCAAAMLLASMLWPHTATAAAGDYAYVPYSCMSQASTKATAQWFSLMPEQVPVWLVNIVFLFYKDCGLVFGEVYEFHYRESFKIMGVSLADIYSYEEDGVEFYFWVFSNAINA